MSVLSNITSPADATKRLRPGVVVYAGTDEPVVQVWMDLAGAMRMNMPADGKRLGTARRLINSSTTGQPVLVELEGSPQRYVPVTSVAVDQAVGTPVEASPEERAQQLVQRDRYTAHVLLGIAASIERLQRAGRPVPQQLMNDYARLAGQLERRKRELIDRGWLTQVRSGFDQAWSNIWGALSRPARIGAIPLVVVAVGGVIALGAGAALTYWLMSSEPASIADLNASLALYNRVAGQLPADGQADLNRLVSTVAAEAKDSAGPSLMDSITTGVLLLGGVGLAIWAISRNRQAA